MRGEDKPDASINFEKGFNAVTGASETGKSFAYSLIDYALGSSRTPECPPEANGYEQVFLELHDFDNGVYTLNRSLLKSEASFINLYYQEVDNINPSEYEKYNVDSRAKNRLSDKLMEIIQCKYRFVQSSEGGSTQSFTFRQFIHALMINENRMYASQSPVKPSDSDSDVANTAAKYAFFSILRGRDYPQQRSNREREKSKAELKGRIDQLDDLSNELRKKIEQSRKTIGNGNIDQIQEEIDRLNGEVDGYKKVLGDHQNRFLQTSITLSKLSEQQDRLEKTIQRLKLLEVNYKSDIDRLQFIEEAHSFSDQLVSVECPLCHAATATIAKDSKNKASFYKSLSKEKQKLSVQLFDLADTIKGFSEECETTKHLIVNEKKKREELEEQIKMLMGKDISSALSSIEKLNKVRDVFASIYEQNQQLDEYKATIETLQEELKRQKAIRKTTSFDALSAGISTEFCGIIGQLLVDWGFTNEKVTFDNSENDVIIGNKKKRSHGQGARALINAAFIIAILKFCMQRELPHPGFVVLDSPLTTYKEKDSKPEECIEDITTDVKNSFYRNLAKTPKDYQIIVFDNYDPTCEMDEHYNRIHFSGRRDIGRNGFIPTA